MNPRNVRNAPRLLVLAAGLTAGAVSAQPGGPAAYPADLKPTHANIAYANTSKSQVLDLFVPNGTGPFPVAVNIHGGGFMFGSKEMLDGAVTRALLKNGIAVASINYRLSGEAVFPAAVLDAKAAVRFLRAKASTYKLNGKIVAFGQSAGANIASMLGTTGGVAEFDDAALGNAGVSSRVSGVINWFGPTDFSLMDTQANAQGCGSSDQTHNQATSFESKYLGATITTVPELVKKANPMTYISQDDAPTLFQKGDQDCTVPIQQTVIFFEAMKKAGVRAEYDLLKGAGHGGDQFSTASNVDRVLKFVQSVLK